MEEKKFKCPCCGYLTLDSPPGGFSLCAVCFWEDDSVQLKDIVRSLFQNYIHIKNHPFLFQNTKIEL